MPSTPDPSAAAPLRRGLQAVVAVICACAMALALGAVWLAVSLRVPSAAWWFALPAGAIMGGAVCAWVTRVRPAAMALAVGGTLLAAIYMKCLYAGLQLAAVMGLPYLHTLHRAGVGMLLALAHASLDTRFVTACVAGMLLALAVAAWRCARTSSRAPSAP